MNISTLLWKKWIEEKTFPRLQSLKKESEDDSQKNNSISYMVISGKTTRIIEPKEVRSEREIENFLGNWYR